MRPDTGAGGREGKEAALLAATTTAAYAQYQQGWKNYEKPQRFETDPGRALEKAQRRVEEMKKQLPAKKTER